MLNKIRLATRLAPNRRVRVTLIVTILTALGFSVAVADAAGNEVAAGQRYYLRYCASCHGEDGSGNGPVAKVLTTRPANLRMLGDRYGMPLPAPRIAALIDGRDTPRAHGPHDMPVWGEELYKSSAGERGEYGIGEVIGDIIAYLDTIQDRRSARNERPPSEAVTPADGFTRYAIVFASDRD